MLWFFLAISFFLAIVIFLVIGLIVTVNYFTISKVQVYNVRKVNCIATIVSVCLAFYVLGIGYVITSSSTTPEKAIKKYALLEGELFKKYTLEVETTNEVDKYRGKKFIVKGYKSGNSTMSYFYLKETNTGWCVVSVEL